MQLHCFIFCALLSSQAFVDIISFSFLTCLGISAALVRQAAGASLQVGDALS